MDRAGGVCAAGLELGYGDPPTAGTASHPDEVDRRWVNEPPALRSAKSQLNSVNQARLDFSTGRMSPCHFGRPFQEAGRYTRNWWESRRRLFQPNCRHYDLATMEAFSFIGNLAS